MPTHVLGKGSRYWGKKVHNVTTIDASFTTIKLSAICAWSMQAIQTWLLGILVVFIYPRMKLEKLGRE
jgi:hypothetical protein